MANPVLAPRDAFISPAVSQQYTSIINIQRRYQDQIAAELKFEADVRPGGSYILESEILPFHPQLCREVLLHLAPIVSELVGTDYIPLLSRLEDQHLILAVTTLAQSPEQDFADALALTVQEVRLDKISGIEAPMLVPLLQAALVPFYSGFARQLPPETFQGWQMGWCPVCGQFPVNGLNRHTDGKRVLGCWLCDSRWSFARLSCLVCGCNESGKFEVLNLAEEPGRRIQLCRECNHYLKITDCQGHTHDCDLMLENLDTIHLDVLAQQDGYRPASGRPLRAKRGEQCAVNQA